jgi:hypothetical protein
VGADQNRIRFFCYGFDRPQSESGALLKKDRAETKAIIEKSVLQKGVDKKKQTFTLLNNDSNLRVTDIMKTPL